MSFSCPFEQALTIIFFPALSDDTGLLHFILALSAIYFFLLDVPKYPDTAPMIPPVTAPTALLFIDLTLSFGLLTTIVLLSLLFEGTPAKPVAAPTTPPTAALVIRLLLYLKSLSANGVLLRTSLESELDELLKFFISFLFYLL
jgi:hypothetical protein